MVVYCWLGEEPGHGDRDGPGHGRGAPTTVHQPPLTPHHAPHLRVHVPVPVGAQQETSYQGESIHNSHHASSQIVHSFAKIFIFYMPAFLKTILLLFLKMVLLFYIQLQALKFSNFWKTEKMKSTYSNLFKEVVWR